MDTPIRDGIFGADDVLLCALASRVLEVSLTDLRTALCHAQDHTVSLAQAFISLEILDDAEIRAARKLVDSDGGLQTPLTRSSRRSGSIPSSHNARYRELHEHDAGGMGRILVVEDMLLDRIVALKEALPASGTAHPHASSVSTSDSRARFTNEALVTAKLEHPAIIPVYDVGSRNGAPFYTMKFIRGRSFRDAVSPEMRLEDRLRLLRHLVDVAQALSFAHERGVIHRDITPTNVMVGEFGETVVLDWGLAKNVSTAEDTRVSPSNPILSALTQSGSLLGTPAYMSPEQAEGRNEEVDARTDIFAVGTLLYLLLTGRAPYSSTDAAESIRRAKTCEWTPVQQLAPGAPKELISIAARAMQPVPAARFSRMVELRDELLRFQDGAFLRSHTYTLTDVLRHYYRRSPLAFGLACSSLLAVALVIAFSYASVMHARDREIAERILAERLKQDESIAKAEAQRQAKRAQIQLAQSDMSQGDFAHAREVLDGIAPTQRFHEWDLLRTLAAPEYGVLQDPAGKLLSARFSPSKEWIASLNDRGKLALWDTEHLAQVDKLELSSTNITSYGFNHSGDAVAVVTNEGDCVLYSVSGRKALWTRHLSGPATSVGFSFGDETVLAGTQDGTLFVYNWSDGSLLRQERVLEGAITEINAPDSAIILVANTMPPVAGLRFPSLEKIYATAASAPLVVLPDGRTGGTRGSDLVVFDTENGNTLFTLPGESGKSVSLRSDPSGAYVISTVVGGPSVLWNVHDRQVVRSFSGPDLYLDAWVLREPLRVVTCETNGVFSLWIGKRTDPVYRRLLSPAGVSSTDIREDGTVLAVRGTGEGAMWNVDTPGGAVPVFYDTSEYTYFIAGFSVSPYSKPRIAMKLNRSFLAEVIVDLSTSPRLDAFAAETEHHSGTPTFIGENTIAFSLPGGQIGSWDLAANVFKMYRVSTSAVTSIAPLRGAVAPSILVGSEDGVLYRLDYHTGESARVSTVAGSEVATISSSPSGGVFFVGSEDGSVTALDAASHAILGTHRFRDTPVRSVVCGQDDVCLVLLEGGDLCKWFWKTDLVVQAKDNAGKMAEGLLLTDSGHSVGVSGAGQPLLTYDVNSLERMLSIPNFRAIISDASGHYDWMLDREGVLWAQPLLWQQGEASPPHPIEGRFLSMPQSITCLLSSNSFQELEAMLTLPFPHTQQALSQLSGPAQWTLEALESASPEDFPVTIKRNGESEVSVTRGTHSATFRQLPIDH